MQDYMGIRERERERERHRRFTVALSRPLSTCFSHTITKMTVVAEESFVQQYLVCTVYSRNKIAIAVKMLFK